MKQFIIDLKQKIAKVIMGIPVDKYCHFIAGVLIVLVFHAIFGDTFDGSRLMAFALSSILAAFIGVLKEIFDKFFAGDVDANDILATFIGGLVTAIFLFIL